MAQAPARNTIPSVRHRLAHRHCPLEGALQVTDRRVAATLMRNESDNREFIHRIDLEDRICFVNDAWMTFADENNWSASAARVLGTPLMSHITDPETRHIYRLLIDRTRNTGRRSRFCYRCDSPDLRRFMEMRISRLPRGQVEFRSRALRLERREPVPVLDPALRQRSRDVLEMCGWCKDVRVQALWLELEEAVQRLGILAEAALPQISHGICPTCSERLKDAGGAA